MENKAGVLVCGFIAVVIITVVLAITYHSVDRAEKFTRMVESGADPLKVKCALEDPNGLLVMPGDSYDIENFIVNIMGKTFKERILNRDGKFIVRPDSPRFKDDTPEAQVLWIVETLGEVFGYTVNTKGYKVLNPKVGTIYGDGLSESQIYDIYCTLVGNGWSAENTAVGQGGGIHQKLNRDTQRTAIKSSAQERDGVWHDVQKNPLDKSKESKAGKLKVVKFNGVLTTVRQDDPNYLDLPNEMVVVFDNGELMTPITLNEKRMNVGNIDVDFVNSLFGDDNV